MRLSCPRSIHSAVCLHFLAVIWMLLSATSRVRRISVSIASASPNLCSRQLSSVLVATIRYERDEVEMAQRILDDVVIDRDRTFPETWALFVRTRVLCLDALGRSAEADHVLAEEGLRARQSGTARLCLGIEAARHEVSLRRGEPAPDGPDQLVFALEQELNRLDASWLLTVPLGRAAIAGLIATGDAARAWELARRLIRRAAACGHGPFCANWHLLAARAAEALGDAQGALAEITAALVLTAPGRLVRPYADILGLDPALLLRALGRHPAHRDRNICARCCAPVMSAADRTPQAGQRFRNENRTFCGLFRSIPRPRRSQGSWGSRPRRSNIT